MQDWLKALPPQARRVVINTLATDRLTTYGVRRLGREYWLRQPGMGSRYVKRLEEAIGGWNPVRIPAVPKLPAWSFQPDEDMPGLYLQCETVEQRAAIMRLLGAPPEMLKPKE